MASLHPFTPPHHTHQPGLTVLFHTVTVTVSTSMHARISTIGCGGAYYTWSSDRLE